MKPVRPLPQAADLFGDIEATPRSRASDFLPGLAVALLATLAALYLSDHYGVPLMLMALLVGLALNFLSADARLTPGLNLAARSLLRIGVVLIGVRITLADVADLGLPALAAVIAVMTLTFAAGLLLARFSGASTAFGALCGGAVAICGGSAAMALAATLGERRISQGELTAVLVGIAGVGAAAMALYPPLATLLGLSDAAAGFLMGAAIHDVAQAVGAGDMVSAQAGAVAAIVKLSRVALLAPILLLVAAAFGTGGGKRQGVPLFLVGFFLLAGVNSLGFVPAPIRAPAIEASSLLMAMAIAAAAIRSPMRELVASGHRPLLIVVGASLVALAAALAAALLLF